MPKYGVRSLLVFGSLAIMPVLGGGHALAQAAFTSSGTVSGTVTAEAADGTYGDWRYTLSVTWATESSQSLGHLDLLLPIGGCDCACSQFSLQTEESAGTMEGYRWGHLCTLPCEATYSCNGDPSLPGEEGPLVKFLPSGGDCKPGPIGTGVLVFYSNWPPAQAGSPNQYLLVKYGTKKLSGSLTGDLPGCQCATATEAVSWGSIKTMFR